jgi:dUTP pyrophosphatase
MPAYTLYLVVEDANVKNAYKNNADLSAENAGFDLVTAETITDASAQLLNLGVRAMLVEQATGSPVHFYLYPRSSIYKTGYVMANSVGIIDKSYRGILKAPVARIFPDAKGFSMGDRHFQIIAPDMGHIREVVLVDSLPETQRGEGGFGSTGK